MKTGDDRDDVARDPIDGDLKEGEPPPHVDVFTIGVHGLSGVDVIADLVTRLGCAIVLDARTKLRGLAGWAPKDLKAALGDQYRVVTAGDEPLADVTPRGPRVLV